jgi:hypothetical protein
VEPIDKPEPDEFISEATLTEVLGDCGGEQVEPEAWPNQLQEGEDLHLALLNDSEARCNDGSAPALYVRRGRGGDEHRWVLHLQGGGDCSSYQSCRDRWCGQQAPYDASKMSSRWLPTAIAGLGIHEDSDRNSLASWSHAWIYYCSSDLWEGDSLTTLADPSGVEPTFTMYRQGHGIVEAALEALEDGLASEDGAEELPSLRSAEEVLWTGTSGGSHGAQIHADAVQERLGPDVQERAIFDASVHPDLDLLPLDVQEALSAYLDSIDAWKAEIGQVSTADQSCLDEVGDAAACNRASLTLYDHVTTPFLTRMDLYDSVALGAYRQAGLDAGDFAAAVQLSQAQLAELELSEPVGAYSQACGQHVGIESGTWTYEATLEVEGEQRSMAAAWETWMGGEGLLWVDELDGSRSTCAELDEER